jgi:hypothetical protein
MIISHKKKFVFLHCRKTAGTFISYLLYEFLENNDLIIGSLEDIYKKKKINIFNHINIIEPSNFFLLIKTFLTTIKYKKNFGFLLNEFYKKKYSRIYANPAHMDISKIRQNFKETDKYFTFCFVRNPYDFEVSDYLWRIKINTKYKNMKFKEYLNLKILNKDHEILPKPITNWNIYTNKNKIDVDFVGRFENLEDDLKIIFKKINIDSAILNNNNIPIKKNTSKKNYQEYYSKFEKDIVEKIHYFELKNFDYKF